MLRRLLMAGSRATRAGMTGELGFGRGIAEVAK